jgi:hypothetical protein
MEVAQEPQTFVGLVIEVMSSFNQGVPTVSHVISTANCLVFGNTSSGNALSVQQLGAGNVASFSNASGGSNVFVMNNLGRVGVGTTNPTTVLQVLGTAAIGGQSYTGTPVLYVSNATTTSNASIGFQTGGGSMFHATAYYNGSASWMGLGGNGSTAPTQGIVNITAGGNVGIGTASPAQQLDVYAAAGGYGYIGNSGGSLFMNCATGNSLIFGVNGVSRVYMVSGSLTATTDNTMDLGGGTGQRWKAVYAVNGTIQTSDARYKDSVPLEYGLNEVLQANTILYSWKTQADLPDTDPEKNFKYFGVCADELVSIMPELCYNENPDVAVQINYAELVPVCINAIKELSAQNKTLEERLAALEGTIGSRLGA